MHLAVVGGRGWLGRAIVAEARRRRMTVTVVARTPGPGAVAVDPGDTSSLATAPSPNMSGLKVSTMTASSFTDVTPIDASYAPGCGPWEWPPVCSVTEPGATPDPERAS